MYSRYLPQKIDRRFCHVRLYAQRKMFKIQCKDFAIYIQKMYQQHGRCTAVFQAFFLIFNVQKEHYISFNKRCACTARAPCARKRRAPCAPVFTVSLCVQKDVQRRPACTGKSFVQKMSFRGKDSSVLFRLYDDVQKDQNVQKI